MFFSRRGVLDRVEVREWNPERHEQDVIFRVVHLSFGGSVVALDILEMRTP